MGEDVAHQHYIVGDNLRHKGFYDDAQFEFLRSLDIREPLLGKNNIDTAKAYYSLGVCKRALKDHQLTMKYLKLALNAFNYNIHELKRKKMDNPTLEDILINEKKIQEMQGWLDKTKLTIARVHHTEGINYQRNASYDKSIKEHRKALALREDVLGKDHVETARSYYALGCALVDRNDFHEALAEYRRALRVRVMKFGRRHVDTNEICNNISTVLRSCARMSMDDINGYRSNVISSLELELKGDEYIQNNELDNALESYDNCLELEEKYLGSKHPATCDVYLKLANGLVLADKIEAALKHYRIATELYELLLGKFHIKLAPIYYKVAEILVTKEDYGASLSYYCKAYAIYEAVAGGKHPDAIDAMSCVCKVAEMKRNITVKRQQQQRSKKLNNKARPLNS